MIGHYYTTVRPTLVRQVDFVSKAGYVPSLMEDRCYKCTTLTLVGWIVNPDLISTYRLTSLPKYCNMLVLLQYTAGDSMSDV